MLEDVGNTAQMRWAQAGIHIMIIITGQEPLQRTVAEPRILSDDMASALDFAPALVTF